MGEIAPTMTPEYIRNAVEYDPETGRLTWRHRDDAPKWWNNKFVGKPAFSTLSASGYYIGAITGPFGRKSGKAHRIAWAIFYGVWPTEIDHINGDKLDNRIVNLRCVDRSVNAKNRRKTKNNKSGETGITWRARHEKWQVQVSAGGRKVFCGSFTSLEEAIAARDDAWRRHGFHEDHGKPRRTSTAAQWGQDVQQF